mgnify:CR=1 FL=1
MKIHVDMRAVIGVAVFGLLAAVHASGLSVTNVTAQQRWPWNGLVDIDYEIVSSNADEDVYVYPTGFDKDRALAIAPRTLTGDGADNQTVKPGKHRMTWNMAADQPTLHSSAFAISVHAFSGTQPYLVLDLSSGPNSLNYPYWYSSTPPDLSNDACRTTNLWLRLVTPGTFMMGSPTDELGRNGGETLHRVTLTKPYYIGVFEMTQKQYALITGSDPSYYGSKGDRRPVEMVSYVDLRGAINGLAWPVNNQVDETSVIGKLRLRTNLTFDLPTEAQWEYACRAGTSTALNSGNNLTNDTSDASLAAVGRYSSNQADGKGGYTSFHTVAGSYLFNGWGIYDMHGNVFEWCLDANSEYTSAAVTDPVGGSGGTNPSRVIRGGYFDSQSRSCRSASRSSHESAFSSDELSYYGGLGAKKYGFRLVVIPPVQ